MKKALILLLLSLLALLSLLPEPARAADSTFTSISAFSSASAGTTQSLIGRRANYHKLFFWPVGTVASCTVKLEQSSDGSSWSDLIAGTACTSAGAATAVNAVVNYVRINVTALSGGGSVQAAYLPYDGNPDSGGSTVAISQSGTDNNVDANITNATLAVTQSGVWSTGRTWTLSSATDSISCSNCGGATPFEDDDAFVATTTAVSNAGFLYDTTPPAITDGSAGAARMSSSRILLVDGSTVTQPVSGSVNIGTFPDNEPFNLAQWGGTNTTLGQKAMTASVPVVLASDQSAVSVTGPLTDAQLRATPVPVSDGAGAFNVTVDALPFTALTYNAPTAASVGVASAQALAANASRKGAIFVNTSNATISCAVGSAAVLNSGITLEAGAAWNMARDTLATGAVNCIASAAASNLSIQEIQ